MNKRTIKKILTLSLIGVALIAIPRRSSRSDLGRQPTKEQVPTDSDK